MERDPLAGGAAAADRAVKVLQAPYEVCLSVLKLGAIAFEAETAGRLALDLGQAEGATTTDSSRIVIALLADDRVSDGDRDLLPLRHLRDEIMDWAAGDLTDRVAGLSGGLRLGSGLNTDMRTASERQARNNRDQDAFENHA